MVSLVVAVGKNYVIGKDNKLIWHLPADLKFFKQVTMGHHMIMGRKTFDSIGKPLPGRTSVVVTRNRDVKFPEGVLIAHSLDEAVELCGNDPEICIIGGAQIFEESMKIADRIYLTMIHQEFDGDVFFPKPDPSIWKEVKREDHEPDEKNPYHYSFCQLEKIK
jgi:dihydrofolate reductase